MARLILALLVLWALPARAQVLSPGPLARDHADLDHDDRCDDCHDAGRGVTDAKCLACHAPIDRRIRAGRGYHGRAARARCASCHRDHLGVDAPLVRWPGGAPERFPHDRTGFGLSGAHAEARCRECHTGARIVEADARAIADTWLGLSPTCNGCHRAEDPHRGQFGDRPCSSCHGDTAWKPLAGFDHARTAFPLRGEHADVACGDCHRDDDWAGTPSACADCHRQPHPPATDFPGDCAGCHVPDGWSDIRYARAEHRRFPLVGGHRDPSCVSCHGDDGNRAPKPDCAGCHEDPHGGRLGRDCATCHQVEGWKRIRKSAFDHDRTDFPLRGRHRRVECAACHAGGRMAPLKHEACADCHRDPHRGEAQGTCEACHAVDGFQPATVGVEAHRGFALEGAHRAVACDECHRPAKQPWTFRRGVARCAECHEDAHRGQFAPRTCEDCHRPQAWSPARFDHALWPLEGGHADAACAACHAQGAYAGTPRECRACHGEPHLGQFVATPPQKDCTACHTPRGWQGAFDHAPVWPLEGAHARAECRECHKEVRVADDRLAVRWRLGFRDCARCHENVHRKAAPEVRP